MFLRFWNDESGAILSAELVMMMSIVVIGAVAGLTSLRDSIIGELADVSQSLSNLDQSYVVGGVRSPSSSSSGMAFVDQRDFADQDSIAGQSNRGLVINTPMLPLTQDNSYVRSATKDRGLANGQVE